MTRRALRAESLRWARAPRAPSAATVVRELPLGATPRAAVGWTLAGLAVLLAGMGSGWTVAEPSSSRLLAVGALAACAVLVVFAQMGLAVLWLWLPLSVVMYPVSGLIGDKLVTFDRAWVGGMLVLLLTIPRTGRISPASRRLLSALILLVAVIGVRTALTPAASLYPARVLVDSLVLPLILFEVVRRAVGSRPAHGERVVLLLMVSGLLLGLIGVAQRILGFELATLSGSEVRFDSDIGQVRLSGPYDVPEVYGLNLVLCLAATLYWLVMRPRGAGAWYGGLLVVAVEVLALFFTFFRVGWISAVIVTVAVLGLRPKRYSRTIGTLVVTGFVCALAVSQLDKIPAVSNRLNNTENISSRLASYEQGLQIFGSAPVFGVGATRYHDVALAMPVGQVDGVNSLPRAHSSVINTLAEDGVVGLAALVLVGVASVGLIRALNRSRGSPQTTIVAALLVGATLSYLLYSLTLTMLPYGPPNAFLAVLLGLGAGHLDHHARPGRASP